MDSAHTPNPTQPSPRPLNPADLWLTLLTPPVLIGILGLRTLTEALQQLGLASEELFRGDRLPTLTISSPNDED
ncbi:MAG TPA: hypothetical protein V6D06_04045 [Trichocoleus sp.]